MSVFDLFRGLFGVPEGRHPPRGDRHPPRGDRHPPRGDHRNPFFDGLSPDDDDDDDEREDGFHHDYFDDALRFGFSFGPDGVRIQEPQLFAQIFQDIEDIFGSLGSFGRDLPGIEAPPQKRPADGGSSRSGRSLRDFMLKHPDDPAPPDVDPSSPRGPSAPQNPFHHWTPFSRFRDIWSERPRQNEEEKKEDGDLDSEVSSGGLDQILTPAPSRPKTRSFFQSVTVTKVVKPDGTVEERRTVRDGQGNEETTVIRSEGPAAQEGPRDPAASPSAGSPEPFSDLHDEFSLFSKFFGSFRS